MVVPGHTGGISHYEVEPREIPIPGEHKGNEGEDRRGDSQERKQLLDVDDNILL